MNMLVKPFRTSEELRGLSNDLREKVVIAALAYAEAQKYAKKASERFLSHPAFDELGGLDAAASLAECVEELRSAAELLGERRAEFDCVRGAD